MVAFAPCKYHFFSSLLAARNSATVILPRMQVSDAADCSSGIGGSAGLGAISR